MKTFPWSRTILILLLLLIFWNYFSGLGAVPFHPDETTQIFMSADALRQPVDLAFTPLAAVDLRMRYRLIDSPITRMLIGWGMHLLGQPPVTADWNWSASWHENATAGALPSNASLLAARWSVAWLFPLTCLFFFLLAKRVTNRQTAILAFFLFSSNALILIHTRRAMAESAALCVFCALAWLLIDLKKSAWFAALAAGLAVNTKQTAIPLAGMGVLELVFLPHEDTWRKRILRCLEYLVGISVITILVNPVFWKYPLQAIDRGIALRSDLSSRMEVDYHLSPNPLERSVILIAQVFIQPPAIADVLNYKEETRAVEEAYVAQPQNNLARGFFGGGVLLILTILGWIVICRQIKTDQPPKKSPRLLFLMITVVCLFSLMGLTAAPFQRYYIFLIPLFSISQAAAIDAVWVALKTTR
ncbi:MAG: phospholipid carrier-dependent glycosyltransferase [Leptolinea sp.]|jgi:4-amino-4-deoxy-L-arabinose transferase-like glycosyltransferase|nr:phospholipid carrier-dependent glycosyltransferase [Leptolinea sp.]